MIAWNKGLCPTDLSKLLSLLHTASLLSLDESVTFRGLTQDICHVIKVQP